MERVMSAGLFLLVVVAVLGIWPGLWVGTSYLEARAYHRITGKNVSTWDAMWLDLRVEAEPR